MLIEDTTMHSVVDFIYYIVSLKLVNKIPYLNDYLMLNKNGDTNK